MKRLFLTILIVGFCLLASAQQPTQTNIVVPNDSTEMPSYPGGPEAYRKFLRKNIHYPEYAAQYGAEGICTMLFIVDVDGSISGVMAKDCKITQINEGALSSMTEAEKAATKKECARQMAKEGMRLIRMMKKWNPGKKNGKPIRTAHTLDLSFSINYIDG